MRASHTYSGTPHEGHKGIKHDVEIIGQFSGIIGVLYGNNWSRSPPPCVLTASSTVSDRLTRTVGSVYLVHSSLKDSIVTILGAGEMLCFLNCLKFTS